MAPLFFMQHQKPSPSPRSGIFEGPGYVCIYDCRLQIEAYALLTGSY